MTIEEKKVAHQENLKRAKSNLEQFLGGEEKILAEKFLSVTKSDFATIEFIGSNDISNLFNFNNLDFVGTILSIKIIKELQKISSLLLKKGA